MNNAAALWYFESVNLYNTLCPHKVKAMAGRHTFLNFKRDQFIYFLDDKATHIYMIVNGRVKIGRYHFIDWRNIWRVSSGW
jgi:CRP/FNR family cyclic AMP-dependent transcriptional regulator